MKYQDLLNNAIDRALEGGRPVDLFKQSAPSGDELEADLEMAELARRQLLGLEPSQRAQDVAARRLQLAVTSARARKVASVDRLDGFWSSLFQPRIGLVGIASVALALIIVAALSLQNGSRMGTPTAEAEVIEGTVTEVGADGIVLVSGGAPQNVQLTGEAVLRDAFGNLVGVAEMRSGQVVILTGSRSNGTFVANSVEFKGKLFGVVESIEAGVVRVRNEKAEFIVGLSGSTSVEGNLAVGAFVEIEVESLADGSLRALEIEIESDQGEDENDENDHPAPGSKTDSEDGSHGQPEHETDVEEDDDRSSVSVSGTASSLEHGQDEGKQGGEVTHEGGESDSESSAEASATPTSAKDEDSSNDSSEASKPGSKSEEGNKQASAEDEKESEKNQH